MSESMIEQVGELYFNYMWNTFKEKKFEQN